MNIWHITGALYGLAGVAGGAIASHALADAQAADMVKTAALYALIHAAVLVCWTAQGKLATAARLAMVAGVALFSGSIALKYLLEVETATRFAPAGGLLLMAAWLIVAISAARRPTAA